MSAIAVSKRLNLVDVLLPTTAASAPEVRAESTEGFQRAFDASDLSDKLRCTGKPFG
jgi:hypothetical protein